MVTFDMPCTQFAKANKWRDKYKSRFIKDREFAHAGFYSVFLEDHNLTAELTTTDRVGIHKYTLEEADTLTLIIDLDHRDNLINYSIYPIDDYTLVGHRLSENWATESTFILRLSLIESLSGGISLLKQKF